MVYTMTEIQMLLIFILIAVSFLEIYLLVRGAEYLYSAFILRQPPFVASNRRERRAIVRAIRDYCPDVATVCDIGSGDGGLSRYVARRCGCRVIGLENMPVAAMVSRIGDLLCPRVRTIHCDAFEYLANTDMVFDVAIAYLGPAFVSQLLQYKDKIRMLIVLDFEIQGTVATAVIHIGGRAMRYNGVLYPRKLFIYKF